MHQHEKAFVKRWYSASGMKQCTRIAWHFSPTPWQGFASMPVAAIATSKL
jgi:hypothetical protein